MIKQFSSACERNSEPILTILKQELAACGSVIEIGSGTGQHAVFFGAHLPHLIWQTSDLPPHHPGIRAWLAEAQLSNVRPPLTLDMENPEWPDGKFDALFTANTCHIMAWAQVENMFSGAADVLNTGAKMCIYGPFNYNGRFTSEGNARFDEALRAQTQQMGIRDSEAMQLLAAESGFVPHADHAMPSNNRLLVWRRA